MQMPKENGSREADTSGSLAQRKERSNSDWVDNSATMKNVQRLQRIASVDVLQSKSAILGNSRLTQLMHTPKSKPITTLVTLNTALTNLQGIANYPGGGLTLAHFNVVPLLAEVDAAIAVLPNTVYDYMDVNDVVNAINAEILRVRNLPPPLPPYLFNDSSTWEMDATIGSENGIVVDNVLQVGDGVYRAALLRGDLTNNSTAGGAAVGVNYHAHAKGGAGGIAFYYKHLQGNDVQAIIYDYANVRTGKSGNDYNWIKTNTKSNTAPARKQ